VLVYGIDKIIDPSMVEYVKTLLAAVNVPTFVAYGVYLGEVVAPVLLIVGWRTRAAAAIMSVTMLVVILLGHTDEIFPLSEFVWWGIELQALFLLNSVAVAFLGAGRLAFSHEHVWD